MAIKNITYQRVINLGDYESKRLELFAEVLEGEDEEEAISRLMEMVERKVREDEHSLVEEEFKYLKKALRELKQEYETVKSSLEALRPGVEEPDPDNIPFESGSLLDDPTNNF